MRVEITLDTLMREYLPVINVLLFTKEDEYYDKGGEEGVYHCACTYPEDRKTLISVIEQSINLCLKMHEESKLANEEVT